MLEAKAFLRGTSTGIAGGFPNQKKTAVSETDTADQYGFLYVRKEGALLARLG